MDTWEAVVKLIALAIGVLGVAVAAALTGNWLASMSSSQPRVAAQPAAPTDPINEPALPRDNDFVGVLLPSQMANLTPRSDAKIVVVRCKVGEAVAKDSVIVGFDLRDQQHELDVAEARLKAALADSAAAAADLAFDKERVGRRSTGVDLGGRYVALVSGEEAASARSAANSARARLSAAAAHIAEQRARVEQLKLVVRDSEIRAPFAGIVSAINFEPGMTVHPGDVVARIVAEHGLRVRIAVPEEQASLLDARHARIELDGRTLDADIDQVSPEPEPASRVFVIEGSVHVEGARAADELRALSGRGVRASLTRR
jgi:multidrug efflux pump subunit AcrA (membrane-fusion protein)